MGWASAAAPGSGRPGRCRCRPSPGRAAAGRQGGSAAARRPAGVGQTPGPEPAPAGLAPHSLARGQPGRTPLPRRRPAHRDTRRAAPWPAARLLIEGPEGAEEPSQYWLSNLPPRTALKDLVQAAKARWLIERDDQELKPAIGLGHYEGRGRRGCQHHASRCIAAYGLLAAERCLFPPQARCTRRRGAAPALPKGVRPRGARPAERHVPNSIAAIRRCLTVGRVRSLPRCPCCLKGQPQRPELWETGRVVL
jgi:hypothetical protein